MKVQNNKIAVTAGKEIAEIEEKISVDSIQTLMTQIEQANNIFVTGAGRSLLMLRAFAMRLMHLGFNSYVVGDTITPAFSKSDLLIVGSASGETSNLVTISKEAKEIGGKIFLLSIFPESTLGMLANNVLRIPAYTDKLPESDENKKNILPGGSMFEISMLVLLDSLIIPLGEDKNIATNKYFDRHANLE